MLYPKIYIKENQSIKKNKKIKENILELLTIFKNYNSFIVFLEQKLHF